MKRLHLLRVVPVPLWLLASAVISPVTAGSLDGQRVDVPLPIRRPAQSVAPKPKVRIVTEASNGFHVTLGTGDTLVVRLPDTPSTGSVWSLVTIPNSPLRLLSQSQRPAKVPAGFVGASGIHEWKFAASGKASFGRSTYLKLLQLRPFEKGIGGARLWEIKVIVPAS